MVIAVNTQVKLIYRPKGIEEARNDAENKLSVFKQNNNYVLKNPTPYYFCRYTGAC